jgi:hypothetical protein
MTTEIKLTVRLPADARAWLEYTAGTNNRSQNAELLRLLADAMRDDPLRIVVHGVAVFGWPPSYHVSIGEFGKDFHEGPDRDAAIAAAMAKARELGLPRSAIMFNEVSDKTA